MTHGTTASMTLSFTATGSEADLAADDGGDVLSVDDAGDALLVLQGGILTVLGGTASNATAEVDLAVNASGDVLGVDAARDGLIVSAGFVWLGASAALVVADPAEQVEGEVWVGLSTESGSAITTEGA